MKTGQATMWEGQVKMREEGVGPQTHALLWSIATKRKKVPPKVKSVEGHWARNQYFDHAPGRDKHTKRK